MNPVVAVAVGVALVVFTGAGLFMIATEIVNFGSWVSRKIKRNK
jgi:hypothetical protein